MTLQCFNKGNTTYSRRMQTKFILKPEIHKCIRNLYTVEIQKIIFRIFINYAIT